MYCKLSGNEFYVPIPSPLFIPTLSHLIQIPMHYSLAVIASFHPLSSRPFHVLAIGADQLRCNWHVLSWERDKDKLRWLLDFAANTNNHWLRKCDDLLPIAFGIYWKPKQK